METANKNYPENPRNVGIAGFLRSCKKMITNIFEPEEVEVNLQEDHGRVISYTYTVLPHKEVA